MATKKVRVNVTARDIRLGQPKGLHYCPIARAVSRLGIARDMRASAAPGAAYLMGPFMFGEYAEEVVRYCLRLPPHATEFMYQFDASNPVKPFRFTAYVEEAV